MKSSEDKTNVMRLLDKAKISYIPHAFAVEEGDSLDVLTAAKRLGKQPEEVFKTLVTKGAKGGYELAKPPKEITLRSVIEAVEGPYMISRCQGDAYSCQRTSCRLHHIYGEVSQLVRDKLESYTFASICACEDTEADE